MKEEEIEVINPKLQVIENFLDIQEMKSRFNTQPWRATLQELELELRKVIRKLGLDLPDADDPRKAMQ